MNAYNYAIKLLTKKDYSSFRLRKKLQGKGFDNFEIQNALEQLKKQKYLNDEEYMRSKIRYYIRRKKGPILIEQKCREEQLPITGNLIHETYEELSESPEEQIREHIKKKMLLSHIPNWEDMSSQEKYQFNAKIIRFLHSKGYNTESLSGLMPPINN